jgi:hypothetical protein
VVKMIRSISNEIGDFLKYYHLRDYSKERGILKRIALAAVPILCLNSTIRYPITVGMGARRIRNMDQRNIWGIVIGGIALVGVIFRYRVGTALILMQDTVADMKALPQVENGKEAFRLVIKIIGRVAFLALAMQVQAIALVTMIILVPVNLIQSQYAFQEGGWIEGVAFSIMGAVRFVQSLGFQQKI